MYPLNSRARLRICVSRCRSESAGSGAPSTGCGSVPGCGGFPQPLAVSMLHRLQTAETERMQLMKRKTLAGRVLPRADAADDFRPPSIGPHEDTAQIALGIG